MTLVQDVQLQPQAEQLPNAGSVHLVLILVIALVFIGVGLWGAFNEYK